MFIFGRKLFFCNKAIIHLSINYQILKMKKLHLALILFISFFYTNLNAQTAQEIFLENLAVFENLKKGGSTDLNRVYESRAFLIEITGITYQMENSFDMPKMPPHETIEEWKSWYDKNKEELYWDKKEKKVKVKIIETPNK